MSTGASALRKQPAPSAIRKRLPWRSRFGSMPLESMYAIVSRYGPCATSLLLIIGIAETSSGYSDTDEPRDWVPDRERLADIMRMSEAGIDKAFAKAQRDITDVIGEDESPLLIKRNLETNSWHCELRPKLIDSLNRLPRCEKRTLPHKAEREEKRRAKVQAILAELKCPECGEPISQITCHHCGTESPVGQMYQTEQGGVINYVPPDTDVIPIEEPERAMAAGAGQDAQSPPPEPQPKTPVLDVPVQPVEKTQEHPERSGVDSKTPVSDPAKVTGLHALSSAVAARLGEVFVQKAGKPLDTDYAFRIAKVLGHSELIPALKGEVDALDDQRLRNGRSGLVLRIAEKLRAGYEQRKRLSVTGSSTGGSSRSTKAYEKYQRTMERHKKGAPNDA